VADNWYTLYDPASGECKAHTSVLPGAHPWTVANHGADRKDQTHLWNRTTRAWDTPIPQPVMVDRLQDLANHPYLADVWTRLTVAQRTKLRKLIVWLLASRRYRQQFEEVSVDPPPAWPTDPAQAVE
jgi:hypothetical protein